MKRKLDISTIKSVPVLSGTLIIFLSLVLLFGCTKKEEEVSFFLENERGTYNLVELSVPSGKGPHPVVFMAHGFAGTLHSGGAVELGGKLAEKGLLAVRIDFNPYVKPDKESDRTDVYPLSQMEDDAVNAIKKALDDYDGDPDNISLYGRSYGGRLVMRMANESSGGFDYKKLALVAPAGDAVAFHRYLGGMKKYKKMKKEANGKKGYSEKLGVKIVPEWFRDVESYDPTKHGDKFGDKPVLLFYNTLDKIVYPDTSIRCAEAYKNHEIVKVTTKNGHGYEMGYRESELKDRIMDKLAAFLSEENNA